MKVYHGSDVRIDTIDLQKGRDFLDFGRGFYVTTVRKHAYQRALRMAEESGAQAIITEFDYHEQYPQIAELKVKSFHEVSEEWVDFVVMNRNEDIPHPTHAYDIVEGPIADDWVTSQIKHYRNGKISVGQLLQRLRFREQTHQICFCTLKSLFALEQSGYDDIYNTEEITNTIVEALIADYDMDEKAAIDTLYQTDVYVRLADMNSGFHAKSDSKFTKW